MYFKLNAHAYWGKFRLPTRTAMTIYTIDIVVPSMQIVPNRTSNA